MNKKNNKFELYTDGACSGNPGPGGWSWVLVSNEEVVLQDSGYEEKTTNNRMELLAVISGLKTFESSGYNGTNLTVQTDSTYVQQGITSWIKKWKLNGWRTANKTPVKNQDLWQRLDLLQTKISPDWKWVKGHAENKFNNLCDELAVKASKIAKGMKA